MERGLPGSGCQPGTEPPIVLLLEKTGPSLGSPESVIDLEGHGAEGCGVDPAPSLGVVDDGVPAAILAAP